MNKLRENTGVILWILVLSFGIIWTLQDSNVFDAMNQPSQNVAMVNGESISNQEYQNAVEQQRRRFQQQMEGEMTGRMQEMMREQAYNQLVESTLLKQEMKRLGISVTDAEIEEMVYGETPDPFIRQRFSDSTGRVNYQLINNLAQNEKYKQQWLQVEEMLKQRRRQQKMGTLVQSTIFVSEADIKDYYWRQNASASVDYVALRYASVPNDSISVSESDLRSYYDNNKEDFKRKKTLTLDYVTLPKTPTDEDTAAVFRNLERNRDAFATAQDDSLFLARNSSRRSLSEAYQTPVQMEEAVADSVFANPTPGRIAGPVAAGDLAHLVKIRDTQPAETEYVHTSHILLQADGRDASLRQRLASIRDSIESGAATFGEMARRHSEDQSASSGGDLGWRERGTMADGFEDAAFSASEGSIVGPVRSEFGYHLIRVHQRAARAMQVADLAFSLEPGQATLTDKQNTLEDVAFYAGEDRSFAEEAKSRGLTVQELQAEADQQTLPGLGQSRAFPSFMEEAQTGDMSDVVELDDKFVLLRVSDVKPEGHRPFEDVRSQIRPQVELQKKTAVQTRRMQRALEQNSFEQLPQVVDTEMRSQSDVTFSTETVPGVGRDPVFSGTAFGLNEGEISEVMEGDNAAFVVRLNALQEPSELTDAKRRQIRRQLRKRRQKEVSSQWIAALKEDATIEDQRREGQ